MDEQTTLKTTCSVQGVGKSWEIGRMRLCHVYLQSRTVGWNSVQYEEELHCEMEKCVHRKGKMWACKFPEGENAATKEKLKLYDKAVMSFCLFPLKNVFRARR